MKKFIVIIFAVILLWAIVVGLYLFKGYQQIHHGVALATEGRSQFVNNKNESLASSEFSQASSDFNSAKADFNAPIVAPLKSVPFVGTQLYSVIALSSSAGTLASISAQTLGYYSSIQNAGSFGAKINLIKALPSFKKKEEAELKSINLGPQRGLISILATQRALLSKYDSQANNLISGIGG